MLEHMTSTTHPADHPAALPDAVVNQLLGQLLHSGEPTHRILESLGLSARQLAAWLHESGGLQMIKDLTELAHARARLIACDALSSAINTLTLIVTDTIQSPRHAETIRKAATTLIRLATAKHPPAAFFASTSAPADADQCTSFQRATDLACPEARSVPIPPA